MIKKPNMKSSNIIRKMPPRRMGTRANPAFEEDQGSHNQDRRSPDNSEEEDEDYNF